MNTQCKYASDWRINNGDNITTYALDEYSAGVKVACLWELDLAPTYWHPLPEPPQ